MLLEKLSDKKQNIMFAELLSNDKEITEQRIFIISTL